MNPETGDLVKYRLSRADEALEEAELLYKSNHLNASVNRLYYACFYAVSALLLNEGLSSSKHSGIRSLFIQRWVKTGRVSKELGQFYRQIFGGLSSIYYEIPGRTETKVLSRAVVFPRCLGTPGRIRDA
jgi:hypothetical protein